MAEQTLELEIPFLLPGAEDCPGACLSRLETALQGQQGVLRAHLECEKSPAGLCLHYNSDVLSGDQARQLAEQAGTKIVRRYHHALIPIEGMDCSDCALVLEHGLERMPGVLAASVSYAAQKLSIEYDAQKTNRPAIEKRIHSLGYAVPSGKLQSWYQKNHNLLFSLLCGLLLLVSWLGERYFNLPQPMAIGLYLAACLLGGWEVARHAWRSLHQRHFDTDLLMMVAAIGAAALGKWAEAAFLLFLFSLGHALEERALERACQAVRSLADLAPKTALVRRDGNEIEEPVEQVQLGDLVIVRPGMRIPVDGEILNGNSAVDQSPVTGEATPVDKAPGDKVFAGTINRQGVLEIRVTRLAKDSTLARVINMVEEAQAQKSPTQQLTERFERIFVPAVLVVDLLLILLLTAFGAPFDEAFLRGMTLLVAASPCALALGTPSAILAGITQAARNGVLVKGGAHLENLGRLRAIAFDKTGTITHGHPEVTDLVAFETVPLSASPIFQGRGMDECESALALAAALESRSAHPLAQAVTRAAQSRGLFRPATDQVEALAGRGLRANIAGVTALVGSLELMEESGIQAGPEIHQKVKDLQSQSKTTMLVAWDGALVGLLGLADTLRPDATAAIENLRSIGVSRTVMLTGDNALAAAAIAGKAGLADFRAELLPEDKLTAVRELVRQYGIVAMVGDGVNDAPALAHATIGIAMGGAGSDVALETADVTLMGDDLSRLPYVVGLGRATRAVIVQNLAIAVGVMAFLVVASLAGWAGIGAAVFLHEGSTVLVVLNALRLLGFR